VGMSLMNRQTYNVVLAWHPGILDSNQVYHSSNNISSKAVPPHQLLPSFLFLLKTSHPFLLPPPQVTVLSYALPPLSTLYTATTPSPILFYPQTHYPSTPPPPQKYRQHTLSDLFQFSSPARLQLKKKPLSTDLEHSFLITRSASPRRGTLARKGAYELYFYITPGKACRRCIIPHPPPPRANKLIPVPFKTK